MSADSEGKQTHGALSDASAAQCDVVPDGYRQGLITAITVLLGFSLTFLRFWGFEAPGQWMLQSVVSTGMSIVAIALQLTALFRSLRLEDRSPDEYRKTVRWFIGSAIALVLGLSFAVVEFSFIDQK